MYKLGRQNVQLLRQLGVLLDVVMYENKHHVNPDFEAYHTFFVDLSLSRSITRALLSFFEGCAHKPAVLTNTNLYLQCGCTDCFYNNFSSFREKLIY